MITKFTWTNPGIHNKVIFTVLLTRPNIQEE